MNVRYRVELSQAERDELTAMSSGGKRAARKLKRAQILLAADAGCSDEEIARTVAVSGSTVVPDQAALRGRQSGAGPERGAAPWRGAQAHRQGGSPAGGNRLRQALRRAAPAGRWSCWPTPWSSSPSTRACRARRCAAGWPRTISSRGAGTCGAFPRSTANTSPAWKTCSTSTPKRPIPSGRWSASTRARSSSSARCASRSRPKPGQLERYDYEYRRNGTVNLFVCLRRASALAQGQGHRPARRRGLRPMHARTRRCPLSRRRLHPRRAGQPVDPLGRRPLRGLRARRSPAHSAPPGVPLHPQARQLAQHGRDRDRRPARPVSGPPNRRSQKRLVSEIAAWERQRNAAGARIKWMFTTDKARTKMGRAYPRHRQRVIITVTRY